MLFRLTCCLLHTPVVSSNCTKIGCIQVKDLRNDNPHVGVTIYCWDLLAYELSSGKCVTCLQIDLFISPLFLIIP